jgi:5-methylcytosine-specific restriction endonuclease McrA
MIKFVLDEYHRNLTVDELVEDLKKVATKLNKDSLSQMEYAKYGKYHPCSVTRRFGSWAKALETAGLNKSRNYGITDEELFENIENVWIKLGRQPYYGDMRKPLSKFSGGTYGRRFGAWRKALEAFIKQVNCEETVQIEQHNVENGSIYPTPNALIHTHKTKRNVSWRLRFIIMKRDNFKCKKCGRSPANDRKVTLQVDHIMPWSKGGETVPQNLETLCMECNIGKSDLEI